ncbi:chlorinating enzyme [Mycobacterium stomatepiae]|uniref:Chemotaxis protein CheX n=1 Tax=Mycobacterium stomatepiae TaxID=470076 RepID=A0A7I7Q827_9MYCO|nr:chlorinating enzyme [Mycobacterium stomatepiae]MCV7163083.1 chlorinating enzyme [Mycobacterium stomatepiae]BBY22242.1 chemotaxis protein CheX [Mycobacterium stomatepiae]
MTGQRVDAGLSADEVAAFRQRGFHYPIKVYEPDVIRDRWRHERLALMDRSHAVYSEDQLSGSTNISNYDRHLDSTFLAEHICHPEIVSRVKSVLGPDVLCWRSEFFPKYGGDEGTDWHQADTFANASGTPQILWPNEVKEFGGTITVWTAFTDATIETGCLQFIPGTQAEMFYDETKFMKYDPDVANLVKDGGTRRGFFGYDYRDLQKDPDWQVPAENAVSIELKAGEAVMFWSTLMHASHPHLGGERPMRLGYVGRYVPTCVRVYPDTEVVDEYGGTISLDKYGAIVVSGRDTYGHNRLATQTTRGFPFPVR